jgi:hypothetical protein
MAPRILRQQTSAKSLYLSSKSTASYPELCKLLLSFSLFLNVYEQHDTWGSIIQPLHEIQCNLNFLLFSGFIQYYDRYWYGGVELWRDKLSASHSDPPFLGWEISPGCPFIEIPGGTQSQCERCFFFQTGDEVPFCSCPAGCKSVA